MYLGKELDSGSRMELNADHLVTHAVCLGMTGSGKTGLGIVALEELASRRVPLLVVDLKGDMVNLLLGFPSLAAEAFAPWVPSDAVIGRDRLEVAKEQAELWRRGLEGSGLGSADIQAVREGVRWQLFTPGVASAAPLDILPALSVPPGWDPSSDPDGANQRVNGVTGALLSLIGRGGDPLSDPDHVLVASVILEHWRRRDPLDLGRLLASLADPPIDTLGALPLETFYPRGDRMKLVLALNALLASPAFAAWTQGAPLTMETLLGTAASPRASVVVVAHLDERQRLFVLALLFSELVAWMRRQPASAGLRALLYLDEVQGIVPPHPSNPPTKAPLMTLLKQGRAFGVGAWLATQNPVDLDYKALGNAGVKLIGRLLTDRDRERAFEGLGLKILADGRDADQVVTSLGKRQFLVDDVHASPRVKVFSSRWAMSYLRGPVTLAELGPLLASSGAAHAVGATAVPVPVRAEAGGEVPPVLSSPVAVRYAARGGGLARPVLVVHDRVVVEQRTLGLNRTYDEWWQVPAGEGAGLDWEAAAIPREVPETVSEPPSGMRFPPAAPARLDQELTGAEKAFFEFRTNRPTIVLANQDLKLVGELEESRDAFLARCLEVADRADDQLQDAIRRRYERRMETLKRRLEREQDELERDQKQLEARQAEEKLGLVEGLFSVLLGSKSVRSAAGKAASKVRSVATKRRMRHTAEGAVVESEREIDRLEDELQDLADELQDEIDRVAAESETRAARIEELAIRPRKSDIQVATIELWWM